MLRESQGWKERSNSLAELQSHHLTTITGCCCCYYYYYRYHVGNAQIQPQRGLVLSITHMQASISGVQSGINLTSLFKELL